MSCAERMRSRSRASKILVLMPARLRPPLPPQPPRTPHPRKKYLAASVLQTVMFSWFCFVFCPVLLCFESQNERLNRGSELTVVHESLLEEDNADEGDALLAGSEKVSIVWRKTRRVNDYHITRHLNARCSQPR